jgi:uncharacterized protein (DUF2141 family)
MKVFAPIFFLFFLCCLSSLAQTAKILVEVENIQHISGSIKVGVFDKVNNYRAKSNPFVKARQTVKDSVAIFVFNDLPIGRYAVASYHDENNDDTLNTKKLGIPIEGIGFSGKFNSRIKPPDFNMASFRLKADTTIVVKLIYNKRNK